MRKSEFDNLTHCIICKEPLSTHDSRNFGSQCPRKEIPFEDECKHENCISVYDDCCHVQLGKWFCTVCKSVIVK